MKKPLEQFIVLRQEPEHPIFRLGRGFILQESEKLQAWAVQRIFGIFIFNTVLVLLLLLHSAGYFAPYFPLTINAIVVISILLSIVLLQANSRSIFLMTIYFWLLATLLKVVKIDVWAERAAIYSFEFLLIGTVLFIIEINFSRKDE